MATKTICKSEIVLEKLKAALEHYGLKYFEFEIIADHGIRIYSESFTQNHLKAMFKVINRYRWLGFVGVSTIPDKSNKVKFYCYDM